MPETFQQVDLTAAEIAKFPVALRSKIESVFRPADETNRVCILVGIPAGFEVDHVKRALSKLTAATKSRNTSVRKHHIDPLIEIVTDAMLFAAEDTEIDLENVQMRAAYLAKTTLLTAANVREQSGLNPDNNSDPASRWKREKKIFAVGKNGATSLYPAFQFENGRPRPVIRKILAEIPDMYTSWQIALWFESGNGWLNGEEPQNCLDRVEDLVMAAKRFGKPTIG